MKIIKNTVFVVASTMLMLVLVEVTMFVLDSIGVFQGFFRRLEMLEPNFNLEMGSGLYYSHPYISYEMRPGYQRDGWAHVNSLGFRGDPISINKAPGTYRIVALGDSTTYGIYNSYDETYPYLLQRQMRNELANERIEVINAGLVSSTTAENLIRLQLRILPLKPDMLILYSGCDIFPRIFNHFEGDYSHFRRSPIAKTTILDHSYIGRLIELTILWRIRSNGDLKNTNLLAYTWKNENLPVSDAEKINNFRNSGPGVFQRNLKYMIDAALDNGVKPVLVTFAFNNDGPKWLKDVPDKVWSSGVNEGNDVIMELARKYQLPLCDFHEYGLRDKGIFQDSLHLNAYGNGKLAECIRSAIGDTVPRTLTRTQEQRP